MDNNSCKKLNIFPFLFKIIKVLFFLGITLIAILIFIKTEYGDFKFDPSVPLQTTAKSAIIQDVVDSSFSDSVSDENKADMQKILNKYATAEILDKTWGYIQNDDEEGFMNYLSDIVSEEDQQFLLDIFGE